MLAKCAGAAPSGTNLGGGRRAPGARAARDWGPAPAALERGGAVRTALPRLQSGDGWGVGALSRSPAGEVTPGFKKPSA